MIDRPYYQDDHVTIFHGDCRATIPRLPNDRFDLVLTDPPYSLQTHNGARTNRYDQKGTPFIDFPSMTAAEIDAVFGMCSSRLVGWCVSFLDWRHVASLEADPPAGLRFVRFGIWDKPNGTPQISGDRPSMGWEAIAILHSTGERMIWNGGGKRAVWTCLRENVVSHRIQKPLGLVKQLAALFSNEGALIIDPFMGSGTTLVAAKEVGCKAIGIEINRRHCETAVARLRQNMLF